MSGGVGIGSGVRLGRGMGIDGGIGIAGVRGSVGIGIGVRAGARAGGGKSFDAGGRGSDPAADGGGAPGVGSVCGVELHLVPGVAAADCRHFIKLHECCCLKRSSTSWLLVQVRSGLCVKGSGSFDPRLLSVGACVAVFLNVVTCWIVLESANAERQSERAAAMAIPTSPTCGRPGMRRMKRRWWYICAMVQQLPASPRSGS